MKTNRIILATLATVAIAAVAGGAWWVHSLGPLPGTAEIELSTQVL